MRDADAVLHAVEGADRIARAVLHRLAGDLAGEVEEELRQRDQAERIRANRGRLGRDPETGKLLQGTGDVLSFESERPLGEVFTPPKPDAVA